MENGNKNFKAVGLLVFPKRGIVKQEYGKQNIALN